MPRTIQEGTMRIHGSRFGTDSGNALVVALLVLMLFTAAGVTFIAVTKSDLIGKRRLQGVVRGIERDLGVPQGCAIACSAHTGMGKDALRESLFELVA